MTKWQWAYVIGCSAGLYFVLTSIYNSQFKNNWEYTGQEEEELGV